VWNVALSFDVVIVRDITITVDRPHVSFTSCFQHIVRIWREVLSCNYPQLVVDAGCCWMSRWSCDDGVNIAAMFCWSGFFKCSSTWLQSELTCCHYELCATFSQSRSDTAMAVMGWKCAVGDREIRKLFIWFNLCFKKADCHLPAHFICRIYPGRHVILAPQFIPTSRWMHWATRWRHSALFVTSSPILCWCRR